MTDLERLDQTIKRLEEARGEPQLQHKLFYLGILQFLRGVLATEVKTDV